MSATVWTDPDELPDDSQYIRVTYDIPLGRGVCQQIRKVLLHIHHVPEEEIPDSNEDLVQYWVGYVLDNTIDNDHERLWGIGEQGRGSFDDID